MAESNSRTRTDRTEEAIGQQRVQGGYVYYDLVHRVRIGAFCIEDAAEDTVNTDYHDEIMSALCKYGKRDSKCTVSSKVNKVIECRLANGVYLFIDRYRQRPLGWVCTVPAASETANTSFRNELLTVIYRYGKVLGLWP